ncbi:hypothetical protein DEU37_2883 [Microbacterium sp. AG790]|uniref:hypothetical protein n=1 Tax=Microbacterium sp. AG790 TaxID=2183995 RepID=UPI000F1C37B5|nr:hypothetical protein [Microbacterium sp. AG790]RKS84826.1 hypothetical protein DEU37_2883 [Microbacterium sp. AG790]
MSDFRFAGRWLNDRRVMALSGDDFRAFVTAGTWMVENRTDGAITDADLDYIPRFTRSSIPNLVAAGLWAKSAESSWQMVEYIGTQTSRAEFEVLDNIRRAEREKKARQRAAKKASPGDGPGGHVPGMSRRTGKDRTGQEGQAGEEGSEAPLEEHVDLVSGVVSSWPTAVPGSPGEWESPDAPGSVLGSVA